MADMTLDPRKVITGKDGRLYVTVDGVSVFLCEVDTFQVQMNITNTDFQPVGDILQYAIMTGVAFTLSYTEAVVRDDLTMNPILDAISKGKSISYDFRGALLRDYDGQSSQMTFNNCVPDGTFDLMNLTPGEVLKRQSSFRINSIPKLLQMFKSA